MTSEPSPRVFSATDQFATQFADTILLLARIFIGWLFLSSGWGKLMNMAGTANYLASLGVPGSGFWVWPAMLSELVIGLTLILGLATRYASLFTALFLVIATGLAHRYWEYPAAQAAAQYIQFCKNLAIFGGTLALFVTGAGRISFDNWLRTH